MTQNQQQQFPSQQGGTQQQPIPTQNGGFGNVERNEGTVFLTPGIHTVAIEKVEYVTPETAKPYIGVILSNDLGTTTQRFYVSPTAKDTSLVNLVHLFNKITTDEELNKLHWPEDDWAAMCAAVSPLVCTGTAIEIKLIGEEYNGRINAKFGFRPFAQKPGEDRLIFNPDTDIKREEKTDLTSQLGAPPAAGQQQPPTQGGQIEVPQ